MNDVIWKAFPLRLRLRLQSVYELPFGVFLTGALVFMVVQNGIWVIPNIETLRTMASDMSRNMLAANPPAEYLYTSFLGLFIGWVTGAYRSTAAFAGLHLVSLVLGLVLLADFIRRHYSDELARSVVLAFACVPLSNVLLTWLGISDVYTFLFGSVLALSQRTPILLVSAFLLGLSHFEQSVLIALLMIARLCLLREPASRLPSAQIAAILAGIALAKLSMLAYFHLHHFNLQNDRLTYAANSSLLVFVVGYFRNLVATWFSFHNVYWIVMVAIVGVAIRTGDRRLVWFLALSHLVAGSVPMVVYDSTRDFALLVWPSLLATLVYLDRAGRTQGLRELTLVAAFLSLFVPKLVVWYGRLHSVANVYDLLLVMEQSGVSGIFSKLQPHGLQQPFH